MMPNYRITRSNGIYSIIRNNIIEQKFIELDNAKKQIDARRKCHAFNRLTVAEPQISFEDLQHDPIIIFHPQSTEIGWKIGLLRVCSRCYYIIDDQPGCHSYQFDKPRILHWIDVGSNFAEHFQYERRSRLTIHHKSCNEEDIWIEDWQSMN